MWDVKKNNLENREDTICPIGQNKQDTTMHISHCGVELENRKHHGKYQHETFETGTKIFRGNQNKRKSQ